VVGLSVIKLLIEKESYKRTDRQTCA